MATALTAGEQTALAGAATVIPYLSVFTPTSVATALVDNPSLSLTNPIADLPVKSASGGWVGAVLKGMTVKAESVNKPATRYFRVRKDASSTSTLPLAEVSWGDTGLMPVDLADGAFLFDNDAITVYDRRDLWTALPRIAGGIIYEDYDETFPFGGPNVNPYPAVNLGKHTSVYIGSAASTSLTFSVAPEWFYTNAAAATPYTWVVPGSWTVTAGGGTNTTNTSVTATVPAGEYWLELRLADTAGNVHHAFRRVWVHNTSNPPLPIKRAQITKTRTGATVRLLLPDTVIAQISDGVMVNYFEVCTWNGSATSVPTASTNVTGWIISIEYVIEAGVRYAEVEIAGPAEMLNRLGGYTQYLDRIVGVPSTVQQIYYQLCDPNYLLWYTLLVRAPSVCQLFDHHFYTTSVVHLTPYGKQGGGSLLRQVQEIAESLSCNVGWDSAGASWVTRHPSLTGEYLTRSVTRRDTLTPTRYSKPSGVRRNLRPRVRKTRLEGFGYDGALLTGYIAEAPGTAPGQGTGEDRYEGRILLGAGEHQDLAGHYYAMANNPYEEVTFALGGNRDVYEPAKQEPVDFQWTAAQSPDGAAWDKSGVPTRFTKTIDDNGVACELALEPETAGAQGANIT